MTATLEPVAQAPPEQRGTTGPLSRRARALGLPSATALVIGSIEQVERVDELVDLTTEV